MNKIRLLFLILVSVISIGCLLFFSMFHNSPPRLKLGKISQFKITKISGNGKVYFDKKPIEGEQFVSSTTKALDIKRLDYQDEVYIKTDGHTGFQLYCFKTAFTILPNSYLYYRPQTKEFHFFSGEFYWQKEAKGKKVDISIQKPEYVMTLSESGRVLINEDTLSVWNYAGDLKLNHNNLDYSLNARQLFVYKVSPRARRTVAPQIYTVPPAAAGLDPIDKDFTLNKAEASIIRFDWRVVKGNPDYKFKLYSSNLRENVLLERQLDVSNVTLDLLQFEEREFYWEIIPIDTQSKLEGVPSKMGRVKMVGTLLEKKNVQKPPELNIKSFTVNGNLVLIKGTAEISAKLYINDELIPVDRDSSFFHTVTFKTIGPKVIVFRLVSPLGVETVEERPLTIYAE